MPESTTGEARNLSGQEVHLTPDQYDHLIEYVGGMLYFLGGMMAVVIVLVGVLAWIQLTKG